MSYTLIQWYMTKSKKRIILSIFLSLVILLITIPQVFAALQAVPVLQAPYNLRDRFDTDLFTGSATYSYDIKVPKGTDDLTPNLAFSYSSAGTRDALQRYGIGWHCRPCCQFIDGNIVGGSCKNQSSCFSKRCLTWNITFNGIISALNLTIRHHD